MIKLSREQLNKIKDDIIKELETRLDQKKFSLDSIESSDIDRIVHRVKSNLPEARLDSEEIINGLLENIIKTEQEKRVDFYRNEVFSAEIKSALSKQVLDQIELPKDGERGDAGDKGDPGKDAPPVELTERDKREIAEFVDVTQLIKDRKQDLVELIKQLKNGKIKVKSSAGIDVKEIIAEFNKIIGNEEWQAGGWEGEVVDVAALPNVVENAGKKYIVLTSTGLEWEKRRGIYRSDGIEWTRLSNQTLEVLDSQLTLSNVLDNTKKMDFLLSNIATGNTRTITMANRDIDLQAPTFDDVIIDGLSGNIITSESVETSIEELDSAAYDLISSGWCSWGGAGNYYSVAGTTFSLLRPGNGRIRGKAIPWIENQDVTLVANACNYVYIDSSGILAVDQVNGINLYRDNVVLFEALYDGTNVFVVKENHTCGMQTETSYAFHNTIGTVISTSTNNQNIGADITRVLTGTGGAAGDRQLKIVGDALLQDHGLVTIIPDSAGSPITINWYYTDGTGHWIRYAQQSEAPMIWNDAGTPTALGSGNYGNFRIYVSKDDLNSSDPTYFAVIGAEEYSNILQAQAAINNGTVVSYTNELYELELAQLGLITVDNSGGGYITLVTIAKKTTTTGVTTGSGSSVASGVNTNTTNFDKLLSATDTTVQAALETIDEYAADKRAANIFLQTQTVNNLELPNTTFTNQNGIITKNTIPFIHDFNYGDNGTVVTVGQNTFVGANAGNLTMGTLAVSPSHGCYNTFIGYEAGLNNTLGFVNVFLGVNAGHNNTEGFGNVFTGFNSGSTNTVGTYNSGYGHNSLKFNASGNYNCAFGFGALANNTIGSNNIAFGYNALASNTIGGANIALGINASVSNIDGSANISIGGNSMLSNISGGLNTVIGPNAFRTSVSGSSNVVIGNSAGRHETGSNTFYIDNQDRTDITGGKTKSLMYGVFSASTANQILNFNANVGLTTITPRRKLDVLDADNPQVRLTYTDNSVYTDFQTVSNGDLIIIPTGGFNILAKALKINTVKSGATQAGAGAVSTEVWRTSGHATLPDGVLMIGI